MGILACQASSRPAIRTGHCSIGIEPSKLPPPAIRHTVLRNGLLQMFGLPARGADAMSARLKALMGGGLRRQTSAKPGRGKAYRIELIEALDVALALFLQRAFVPPTAAISFLQEHRNNIDRHWRKAASGEQSRITVSVDAFALLGGTTARTGRFSQDATGTIEMIACRHVARMKGQKIGPPSITIDLQALHSALTECLLACGMPSGDLRTAEECLFDRELTS